MANFGSYQDILPDPNNLISHSGSSDSNNTGAAFGPGFATVKFTANQPTQISRTNSEIDVTILSTGSEVELAIEVSQKLAIEKIYSKVISMPCHELFDIQKKDYKSKILNETKHKISIEASTTDYWKKYIGENGIAFGIDNFGKSAPYKEIYEHFGLTSKNIVKKVKEMINNKT